METRVKRARKVSPCPAPLSLAIGMRPPVCLEAVLPFASAFLPLPSLANLRAASKALQQLLRDNEPEFQALQISKTALDAAPNSPSYAIFAAYGTQLHSLTLHRVPFADRHTLPTLLRLTPNLRKLALHDCDWSTWDDEAASAAISALSSLTELRLHCGELAAERNPFSSVIPKLRHLSHLRKLTLFSRLDSAGTEALAAYLSDPNASRKLIKVKFSVSLVSAPGGSEVIAALGRHSGLQKLTVLRPDGMGEPLRKAQCAVIAQAMFSCRTLKSVHLRRAGMWTDTLAALAPPGVCPHIKNIKLDGNSLGYLSHGYFNEAMDTLLSRTPNVTALHLGNNQLDSAQAVGLAQTISRHKLTSIENLTLGSNDIGDTGLAAILKILPPCMRQLYLHGCDIHDDGLIPLRDALDKMPNLWGLGLNGNPITDSGVRTLCRALRNRLTLRDVGITLSDMTDQGVIRLGNALRSCENLRFVYLYTQGFKAATKVTDEGKARLRELLPAYATPAFDHRLSRYLKHP